MVLRVSLGKYSDKHIEQVLSSGLGKRLLSPNIIFGYDSIVGPSSPPTMLGSGATVGLSSERGWCLTT